MSFTNYLVNMERSFFNSTGTGTSLSYNFTNYIMTSLFRLRVLHTYIFYKCIMIEKDLI
jgi:hypothetical protein